VPATASASENRTNSSNGFSKSPSTTPSEFIVVVLDFDGVIVVVLDLDLLKKRIERIAMSKL